MTAVASVGLLGATLSTRGVGPEIVFVVLAVLVLLAREVALLAEGPRWAMVARGLTMGAWPVLVGAVFALLARFLGIL